MIQLGLALLFIAWLCSGCDGCGTAYVLDTTPHGGIVDPPMHGAEDLDGGADAGEEDAGHREWRERIERITVGVRP
jgi:hypothetical protein